MGLWSEVFGMMVRWVLVASYYWMRVALHLI